MNRSVTRTLAGATIAGQALFVAAWAVAGALEPGYSQADDTISGLAATGAAHPAIVIAGFAVLGASIVGLAIALRAVLPRRRAAAVAVGLFVAVGVGFVLIGAFRADCDLSHQTCSDRFDAGLLSWHTSAHVWTGLVTQVALLATPFALARALWPRFVAGALLVTGVVGLEIAVGTALGYQVGDGPDGVIERLQLAFAQIWFLEVAAGVLYATRREPDLSAPIPARPRDFFGPAWAGEGEVVLWPSLLWRRVPIRFNFTRTSTFHSDELWTVDDRAEFGDGHVERRRRFCQLVGPARVHVTSDDMPDGADVMLVEDGYRISSYRVLVPIGPLRIPLRARDDGRLGPDGTLIDTISFRWLGLPVGTMTGRARPVAEEPSGAGQKAAPSGVPQVG
jgi:hypothetical membrane protein